MKLKHLIYIGFFLFSIVCGAQIPKEYKTQQKDSTVTYYYIVQGDTIPREYIDLEEVVLLNKLSFNNKVDRRRYLILRRKTRKVYPYAKLASERLLTMTKRLQTIKKKRQASKYTKRIQKYIEQEFSEKLKKLTRTEGQILVKLIHRQTGTTAYDLVKEFNSFYQNVPIFAAQNTTEKEFRVALCGAVSAVIKTAFSLLGIQVPNRM